MRFGSAGLWFGMISALCVLYVALFESGRTSPGPLSTPHAREKELRGQDGCVQCHGDWGTSMTESCLECHDYIEGQIEEGTGLHGSLDADDISCARCHSEHHGRDFDLINRQSFARAGAPDPNSFDHALVGFPMYGKHAEAECSACHEYADHEVIPKGKARYVGLDSNCASCHDDSHNGEMVVACAMCHSQNDWTERGTFGHEKFLPLVGGHEAVDCGECHKDGTAHSIRSLGLGARQNGKAKVRACTDCHRSPHDTEFLRGNLSPTANADRPKAGRGCVSCHAHEHTSFRDDRLSITPQQHAASGFALDFPHDSAACDDCHAPEEGFRERFPGRGADDCASCHADPHEGQFDTGPFAAQGCVGCHDRHRFEPHAFDEKKHARAFLPLDGSHAKVDCYVCHEMPETHGGGDVLPARVFRGTPKRCEECHEDGHRGFFDKFDAIVQAPKGSCAECHESTNFTDVPDGRFEHGRWTGLAIHGAHAQTSCETCHPRSREPDDAGRTFGFVAEHLGTYEGCNTCHIDPHDGEFDDRSVLGAERTLRGSIECSSCHVQSSFRAFPDGWDHGAWTGFELEGEHGRASCSSCHPPQAPDELGRTWGRANGSACSDCHTTPHAGQFRLEGETVSDCGRCHESAFGFEILSFDHGRDSRFDLTDTHAKLDCGACHVPWETSSGAEVVRYRPLGTNCVDCHGKHDGQGVEKGRRR